MALQVNKFHKRQKKPTKQISTVAPPKKLKKTINKFTLFLDTTLISSFVRMGLLDKKNVTYESIYNGKIGFK